MAICKRTGESARIGDLRPPSSVNHERIAADELTAKNVRLIAEHENTAKTSVSPGERIAVHVAAFCGSTTFLWLHVAGFGTWIVINTSAWFAQHPDPFPFTFLTFLVSLEAIFLSAFILISQNQETRLTERRSHLDLQINLMTERENTQMLKMLQSIAAKMGAEFEEDPDLSALQESTRPERLMEQIDQATQQPGNQPIIKG